MKVKTILSPSVCSTATRKKRTSKSRDSVFDFASPAPGTTGIGQLDDEPLVDAETVNLQWKFYCERFFRSIGEIKALMGHAHPGSDREVLKQLNAGRDPLHVFSDFAVRNVNVFQAVSSSGPEKIQIKLNT